MATPRNLDLASLRSVVAIVDAGTMTRAAARLHLTQSAISMQIKRLESTLGSSVFDRSPQGLTHAYGSLRASGVVRGEPSNFADPSNPQVSFVIDAEGQMLGGYQALPRPLEEGGELIGEVLALEGRLPAEVADLSATLWTELTDACGTVLFDERRVVLQPAPGRALGHSQ